MEEIVLNTEKSIGRIIENRELAKGVHKIRVKTEAAAMFSAPGQYAKVGIPGTDMEGSFPISEYDSARFTIVFNEDSPVAKKLITLQTGDEVSAVAGLGEGFDIDAIPNKALLVADTTGIPQMLGLVRELLMRGKTCSLVLGFPSKDSIYMVDTFSNLCNNIEIVTADGSNGRQGYAYDVVRKAEYVCAAGSAEMLDKLTSKAAAGQFDLDGLSLTKW